MIRDVGLFCGDTGLICGITRFFYIEGEYNGRACAPPDRALWYRDRALLQRHRSLLSRMAEPVRPLTGLFGRDMGLCCRDTRLFCRDIGLFCGQFLAACRHKITWESCRVCSFIQGRYSTLQHTVTRCRTLQHTACRHTITWKSCRLCSFIQGRCNTMQHTATHCNTLRVDTSPHRSNLVSAFPVCRWYVLAPHSLVLHTQRMAHIFIPKLYLRYG